MKFIRSPRMTRRLLAVIFATSSFCFGQSPVVSISPSGTQTIVVGQSQDYSSTATDSDSNMFVHSFHWCDPDGKWNWENNGAHGLTLSGPSESWFGGDPSSSRSMTVTATRTGTFQIQWAAADPGGWVHSTTYSLVVTAAPTPPSITTHPQSQTVNAGTNVTFTVEASGSVPFSYQWRKGGANLGGATSSSLTLNNVQGSNAGSYDVIVSNPAGSATSNAATLTVNSPQPPVVSISPTGNQAITVGQQLTYSSLATDADSNMFVHSFHWCDPDGKWNWQNNGATGLSLSGPSESWFGGDPSSSRTMTVTATRTGTFQIQWAAADPGGWVHSATYNLTVTEVPPPPSITTHPQSQSVSVGANVTFTVSATGGAPLSYQWRKGGSEISGATASSLTLNNVQPASAGSYDVVVSNSSGSATSNPATLTVGGSAVPSVTNNPTTHQSIAVGGTQTYSSVATDGDSNMFVHAFHWKDPDGKWNWENNGANGLTLSGPSESWFGGDPSSTRSLTVTATRAGVFHIKWAAADPSGWYDSPTTLLTVGGSPGAPAITTHPQSQSVSTGASVTFNVTATGTAPLTYQWRKNGVDIAGATAATYAIASAQPADAGSYTVVVSNSVPPPATSNAATLTVGGPPGGPLGVQPAFHEVDGIGVRVPDVGSTALRVLTPNLLEIVHISSRAENGQLSGWNYISNDTYSASSPQPGEFSVTAGSASPTVSRVSFKRRALYSTGSADVRIANSLVLELASPADIAPNTAVSVTFREGTFSTTSHPMRYSPAIHVSQEGYAPGWTKRAYVGYYLGKPTVASTPPAPTELILPEAQRIYKIVRASDGSEVGQGTLAHRYEQGLRPQDPAIYQHVYEADFSTFTTEGEYHLVVPGLGASLPFRIHAGAGMNFARTYALGLLHQRCGFEVDLPYSRFYHPACHTHEAFVPIPAPNFVRRPGDPYSFSVWKEIQTQGDRVGGDVQERSPPYRLVSPETQRFPIQKTGTVNVTRGHHDAGDYSKYTFNSADLIHLLIFAVDYFSGVAALNNFGLPPTDGQATGLMEEAKWEADFLVKMQDSDGGFFYLVYPREGVYESGVQPHDGVEQVVWPKNTISTGAAVAALAQIGTSPAFKQKYPDAAQSYRAAALAGWNFLKTRWGAAPSYVQVGADWKTVPFEAYQRLEHFGEDFADADDLVWAACEIYLMAEAPAADRNLAHQKMMEWFPGPTHGAVRRWGWKPMWAAYGNALRSYSFAAFSNRVTSPAQDAPYLAACRAEVKHAADATVTWANSSAYRVSYEVERKNLQSAGWMMTGALAYDLAVGYELADRTGNSAPLAGYLATIVQNLSYEVGANPVNRSFVSGFGQVQLRNHVHQYPDSDRRALPISGIPMSYVQSGPPVGPVRQLSYPRDPVEGSDTREYPLFDRWTDMWNTELEFTHVDVARSWAAAAFIAAVEAGNTTAWTPVAGTITVSGGPEVTATLTAPGFDLSTARITWEAAGGSAALKSGAGADQFTFTAPGPSPWVEAEARWPDGKRVFARHDHLPRVSVVANDSVANIRPGTDPAPEALAEFTFTRTGGDQSGALLVKFGWAGRANEDGDYRIEFENPAQPTTGGDRPNGIWIPAGTSTVTMRIRAIGNGQSLPGGTHYAHLVLQPDHAKYTIGAPAGAVMNILP